jgi:hypothetical protein
MMMMMKEEEKREEREREREADTLCSQERESSTLYFKLFGFFHFKDFVREREREMIVSLSRRGGRVMKTQSSRILNRIQRRTLIGVQGISKRFFFFLPVRREKAARASVV